MAVVVAADDAGRFITEANEENLEAYQVAVVTDKSRMTMTHDGEVIADLSREFLSSNGAEKHVSVIVPEADDYSPSSPETGMKRLKAMLGDLRYCSQRGLGERFDSTVGAGSVLMPYGGETQRSPAQAMAALLPVLDGETDTCSVWHSGSILITAV